MKINTSGKNEARHQNALAGRSYRPGKVRNPPNSGLPKTRKKVDYFNEESRKREAREIEIQTMVNMMQYWVDPTIYAGNIDRSWVEVFLMFIKNNKLEEKDQKYIVQELYAKQVASPSFNGIIIDELKSSSVSVKLANWANEMVECWETWVEENRQATEFNEMLGAL